ncbi:hypothetical protein BD289DRAFT_455529 [Coniella lustricola]|uniref:UBA/TS-N domain-containing protein n=1 Tax=Coniella lustricola TaxID=2025994 RepID=A0A2T2ZZC9_9PEZI|nr:hypothetical protein BD289DRAFT_455529 [Coniella lustricola]
MAESSSVDPTAPNLNLTADEKRVYGQLFRQADTDNVGVVTGELAVKFFEKTRLDSRILGEVWQIADRENRGFLTPAGFGVALRLIGHAQAGREPSPQIALQPGPIPRFDGFTPTPPPLAPAPTGSPQPISAQGTGNAPIRIPPLLADKVAQYAALFERQPLSGSMLSGEQARQIFEKSGLPNETLGRIWQLADTEQRGALVMTEFVIAMHLLTSMKSGALRALPNILPAALYEAATRRAVPGAARPQSPSGPALSAIPRQLSGQAQLPMRPGSSLGPTLGRSPLAPQATGDAWLVTPSDKMRFDQIYDSLDKQKKGYITGEEAVPFFSQSGLPEAVLANIWDLADIRSEGILNRDEFSVAMYLIRQQRSKPGDLPQTLPPNLMPPSLRGQGRPSTAVSASAFDAPPQPSPAQQPPPPKPASALDDLFGLDSTSPPATELPPQSTGGAPPPPMDPFGGSASPAAPNSPARMSPMTTGSGFKPFMPSSSFGRSLTTQNTGASANSSSQVPNFPRPPASVPPPTTEDLLGDAETETKGNNLNDTMELANLSNQIGTLSKSMQDVQGQRNAAQNELNTTAQQKKNFEQRLAQLRTLYENQAKEVRELQDKLTASRNETKKLQTDCAMVEASYQDLQSQHQTILTALQADQQENANLKEKIRAMNAEVAAIKPQIEKLKSEARQQKGMVAINKKQLATNEGERDKLKTEAEDLTKETQELARQLSQSPVPSGPPPQVASPAPSNASGNNPFFRRTGSTDIMGAFASPPAPGSKAYNDKTFDDVFGPTPQAFQPQTTGASAASTGSFATPISNSPNVSRNPTFASESTPIPPEPRQASSPAPAPAPAAAPVEPAVAAPSEAMTTIDGTVEPKSPEAPAAAAGPGPESFFPEAANTESAAGSGDPFSALDEAKAKEDFENAFASFKKSSSGTKSSPAPVETADAGAPKGLSAFHAEFPPISELEADDESDSESDQGGFDDDFAPSSPNAKPVNEPQAHSLDQAVSSTEAPAAAPATEGSSHAPELHADSLFGSAPPPGSFPEPESAVASAPSAAVHSAAASKQSSSAFDDLDDDFADLEDAKEGSQDDDFQTISRSGFDEFNPTFDSPSSTKRADAASASLPPPGSSSGNPPPFSAESTFDFASIDNPSSQASAAPSGGAAKPAESHDWDAIFSSLDDAPPATTSASSPPPGSPGSAAPTASGAVPAAASTVNPATSTTEGRKDSLGRPEAPGRALTEEGVHDDPILKNLTSMGYSRTEALSALEKYDYNLERAANHLANQS